MQVDVPLPGVDELLRAVIGTDCWILYRSLCRHSEAQRGRTVAASPIGSVLAV